MADEDDIRNEIAALQHRANETTDKSLASTDHMVNLVYEAREAGGKTTEMLVEQREQLRRIDGGLDDIHEDMNRIDVDITELEKCCGLCVCPWHRVKPLGVQVITKQERLQVVESQPTHSTPTQESFQEEGRFIKKITVDAREDQMEENLTQITSVVTELGAMAVEFEKELRLHEEILDNANGKAEANKEKIQSAHHRLDLIDKRT